MSVLVKNMKIPVSCYECPMAEDIDMQEDWYTCKLLKKEFYSWNVTEDTKEYHRPKECPLVEVPTPHGRLIDAEALRYAIEKRIDNISDEDFAEGMAEAITEIDLQPTIDAEPVRHGKWNRYYRMHSRDTFVCDRCGSCFVVLQGADKMNFCPHCGARMDKDE